MANFTETEKPTNESQIRNLENKLGISFPTEYVAHLLKYNGGRCDPSVFSFEENGVQTQSSIDWFLALYDGKYDNLEDYCDTYKVEEKRIPDTFFPIGHDSLGNLICIDSHDGKVYFWDHEREVDYYESDDSNRQNIYFIAENLHDFISNLTSLPEY